jgi:hypothetical protein
MAIECARCGAGFVRKQHLAAHIERVNRCSPLLQDLSVEVMLKNLNIIPRKKRLDASQQQIIVESTMRIQRLEDELAELKSQPKVNIENQTVIINLHPFGQERTDHITDEEIVAFLKQYKSHFIDMMNRIYELPENQNVRMLSLKNKLAIVYTGGPEWAIRHSNEVVDAMIQKTNDLGCKVYHTSEELQKMDSSEEKEYAIRKLLTRIGSKENLDYYAIKSRVIADLYSKKRQQLTA